MIESLLRTLSHQLDRLPSDDGDPQQFQPRVLFRREILRGPRPPTRVVWDRPSAAQTAEGGDAIEALFDDGVVG